MTTATAIFTVLSAYGFKARANRAMFWGVGSLVWGHAAMVKACGRDLYSVTIHHWEYDQDGDPLYDTSETQVLHGAQALTWIFTEMPQSFWRHR